jgi:hypothetical protein
LLVAQLAGVHVAFTSPTRMRINLLLPLLALVASATPALAQTTSTETAAVKQTINAFFEGMRRGDSTLVRRTLAPGAVLHSIGGKPGQPAALQVESVNGFLKAVGSPHAETWDERVQVARVLLDASLASVWAPYEFYLGSKFSHCGYDSFQLVKLADGWKIAYIIDTRRKEKCR